MIKLVFFANLKEELGCSEETLIWHSDFNTVQDIIETLKERGPNWLQPLSQNPLLIAVNQNMAQPDTSIKDGDEIAFFPPVTGG